MPQLSDCLNRFAPSRIGAVFDLATRLSADGRTIYDLSSGEPDFATDDVANAAAHEAIDAGDTKYTETDGSADMKEAVRNRFIRDGHPRYDDTQIAVGNGAKPLLAHIFMALLNPGDDVIIPTPCWASHPGMVQVLGAHAVFVAGDVGNNYKLTPALLRRSLTSSTRAIILCSPGNPTGAVYDRDELRALADVLVEFSEVWIVADEIYSEILFDNRSHHSMAVVAPELTGRTVTVNGVSKSFAMTGWRIGYAAGPANVIAGLRQLMSQVAGSPCSISQAAAIAALNGPDHQLIERRRIYQSRRDTVVQSLGSVSGLKPSTPEGAFYLFVDCANLLGKSTPNGKRIESSSELTEYFLEHSGVAVVPGEAFETPGTFRLSFATSTDVLENACAGIAAACGDLN